MKKCTKCNVEKNIDMFVKGKTYRDGYAPWCRSCRTEYSRNRRASGKRQPYDAETARWHQIKHRYKMTQEEYEKMFEAQGNRCYICKEESKGGSRQFSVDHDHSCCPGKNSCGKCVRAILCHRCNTGLGMVQENPEILSNMLTYLQNFAF